MKTDKTVNRLNKRLEEKYPLEILSTDKQEGIDTWKGKRILPVDLWLKKIASLENDKVVFDLRKGVNYFPDSTSEVIFQYKIEGSEEYYKEIPKETFDNWFNGYLDLLTFKKNPEFGNMICKNCLLDPTKDRSGLLIGVHKMVAKTLQKELEANTIILNDCDQPSKYLNENGPIYPCNVLNYFSCPYECKDNNKKFEHEFNSDIEYLFELDQITHLVDTSLLKASTLSQSNETIYEIDIENNTMKEIQTLYNGKQIVAMQYDSIEKGKDRILEKSVAPVRNKEDVLEILKDKDNLNKILKQGLSREEYEKWHTKILNYFEQNRNSIIMDLNFKYDVYENKQKHFCHSCDDFANIKEVNQNNVWLCFKHWKHFQINSKWRRFRVQRKLTNHANGFIF